MPGDVVEYDDELVRLHQKIAWLQSRLNTSLGSIQSLEAELEAAVKRSLALEAELFRLKQHRRRNE